MALDGDTTAMRLCLERIMPPRKDRPIQFTLPPITTAAEAGQVLGAIVAAVAAGDITPAEAGDVSKLVGDFIKALEAGELERRIAALEQRSQEKKR
jgi:hypothetical protein